MDDRINAYCLKINNTWDFLIYIKSAWGLSGKWNDVVVGNKNWMLGLKLMRCDFTGRLYVYFSEADYRPPGTPSCHGFRDSISFLSFWAQVESRLSSSFLAGKMNCLPSMCEHEMLQRLKAEQVNSSEGTLNRDCKYLNSCMTSFIPQQAKPRSIARRNFVVTRGYSHVYLYFALSSDTHYITFLEQQCHLSFDFRCGEVTWKRCFNKHW